MQSIRKGVGFIPADRKIQIEQHPAVIAALQLRLGTFHLGFCITKHGGLVSVKLYDTSIHLIADKQEHIHQRHLIGTDISHEFSVIALLCGIGGIDHLRHFVIKTGKLGKLPWRQLIRQHITVHGLYIGKPHRVVDLVHAVQLVQQGGLLFIVPGRDDQRHHVFRGKGVVNEVLCDLRFVELRRGQDTVPIGIGAFTGNKISKYDHRKENKWDDLSRRPCGLSDKGNFRDKVSMLCFFNQWPKQHQQARHDNKYRQQCIEDGLDQADAHVRADLELHEEHGAQAADGGEGTGTDLRDGLAERCDGGFPGGQCLVLLLEAIAENDGVVQRQCQLKNARNGIGDKGDLAQQKVASLIQDHSCHECQ